MLAAVHNVFGMLNRRGVRYCHWKSNYAFEEGARGKTDMDILVDRRHEALLRAVFAEIGLRPGVAVDGEAFPSVQHFYALDESSGSLVDFHVYFQTITGQSLLKGYRLPIAELLLANSTERQGVRMPTKAAELILYTLRMACKYGSLIELVFLARKWHEHRQEADWLMDGTSPADTEELRCRYLPGIDAALFMAWLHALIKPESLSRRVRLARRMRRHLRVYSRYSLLQERVLEPSRVLGLVVGRFVRGSRRAMLGTGGAVIAFVGSNNEPSEQAAREIEKWLGKYFAVHKVSCPHALAGDNGGIAHCPGAPATKDSFSAPAELPKSSSESVDRSHSASLMTALRSIRDGYRLRRRVRRAYRDAANGAIVLCGGYPCRTAAAAGSNGHSSQAHGRHGGGLSGLLHAYGERLRQQIPDPDLVIEIESDGTPAESSCNPVAYRPINERLPGVTHETSCNGTHNAAGPLLNLKRHIWKSL